MTTDPSRELAASDVERDLWWGYLCPALANISPLKQAQSELIALGADWAEAGRILSRVHSFYVDAASKAAQRYLAVPPADANAPGLREAVEALAAHWSRCWGCNEAAERDCPVHGSDDCRHMAQGVVCSLRALLATQPDKAEGEA